jgi:23S rRNA pseudouridine1911/1915/1917 synthase
VGDPEYGGRRTPGGVLAFGRQALHAARLALAHPLSGEPLAFDAAPPADFAQLVDTLRRHAATR